MNSFKFKASSVYKYRECNEFLFCLKAEEIRGGRQRIFYSINGDLCSFAVTIRGEDYGKYWYEIK